MTNRRAVLVGLAATLAVPRRTAAQRSNKLRRVGVSYGHEQLYADFAAGLRDLGWVNGQNVEIVRRQSEGPEPVGELIRLGPDAIFASNPVPDPVCDGADEDDPNRGL